MADFIFFFHRQFRHGFPIPGQVEKGIIAEAALSLVEIPNDAFAGSFGSDFLSIRPDQSHYAYVASFAVFSCIGFQIFNKFPVVGFIITVDAGIAGRINTGPVT